MIRTGTISLNLLEAMQLQINLGINLWQSQQKGKKPSQNAYTQDNVGRTFI